MGTQSSRVEHEDDREESPLPRASDTENAFEDLSVYRDGDDSDAPVSSSKLPRRRPQLSTSPKPDAPTARSPARREHLASRSSPSRAAHSAALTRGKSEENLAGSQDSADSDARRILGFTPVNRKGRKDSVAAIDEPLPEQHAPPIGSKKKKDKQEKKEKKSKKQKKAKVTEDSQQVNEAPEGHLPGARVHNDPLAPEDRLGQLPSASSSAFAGVIDDKNATKRGKKNKSRVRTLAGMAQLDLEEDPITESQDISVPSSLPVSRNRRGSKGAETPSKSRAGKKRKVITLPEPVEEFDGEDQAIADVERIEDTQDELVPRPSSPFIPSQAQQLPQLDPGAFSTPTTSQATDLAISNQLESDQALPDAPSQDHNPTPTQSSKNKRKRHQPPWADGTFEGVGADQGPSVPSPEKPVPRIPVQTNDLQGVQEHEEPEDDNMPTPKGPRASTSRATAAEKPKNPKSQVERKISDSTTPVRPRDAESMYDFDEGEGGKEDIDAQIPLSVNSAANQNEVEDDAQSGADQPPLKTLARRPRDTEHALEPELEPEPQLSAHDNVETTNGLIEQASSARDGDLDQVLSSTAAEPTATTPIQQRETPPVRSKRRPKVPYFDREEESSSKPSSKRLRTDSGTAVPSSSKPPASGKKQVSKAKQLTPQLTPSNASSRSTSRSRGPVPNGTVNGQPALESSIPPAGENEVGVQASTPNPATSHRSGGLTDEEGAAISEAIERFRLTRNLDLDRITELVHQNPKNGPIVNQRLWEAVQAACPSRKRQKLIDWCRQQYHTFVARGTWTREQDEELADMIAKHGTKWSVIGKEINRHPNDVRDRYRNYLACGPSQNKDYWTQEEEDRLREIVNQCLKAISAIRKLEPSPGDDRTNEECIDWDIVSQKMNRTRSRRQCLEKWKKLRDAEEVGHCADLLGSGSSWRLERARKELRKMTHHDKYLLVQAILETGAKRDSKIAWEAVQSTSFQKPYEKTTLAVCWGRLKRAVPGWPTKTTNACAAHLCKQYEVQSAIELDIPELDFDDEQEESIVEFMAPSSGRRHSGFDSDRTKVHRTPRAIFTESLLPVGIQSKSPRINQPTFNASGSKKQSLFVRAGPSKSQPSSSLATPAKTMSNGPTPSKPPPPVKTTSNGPTPSKPPPPVKTTSNGPASSEPTKPTKPTPSKPLVPALSAERVKPGDSDTDSAPESPRPPKSTRPTTKTYSRRNLAKTRGKEARSDKASIVGEGASAPRSGKADSEDAESVDLGFDNPQMSPARSEAAESVDLSVDADRSIPAPQDDSVVEDSILDRQFNGRSARRATRNGATNKTTKTIAQPLGSSRAESGPGASRKRARVEDDATPTANTGKSRSKRLKPQPEPESQKEEIPESDVEREKGTVRRRGGGGKTPKRAPIPPPSMDSSDLEDMEDIPARLPNDPRGESRYRGQEFEADEEVLEEVEDDSDDEYRG